ncbi:MAG: hypothetical protein ACRDPK_11725 [Carbonactinosporaceae bacterium]
MSWVFLYVPLAVCGLAVLGFLGVRVWLAVQELARTLAHASARLADAASALESAAGTPHNDTARVLTGSRRMPGADPRRTIAVTPDS